MVWVVISRPLASHEDYAIVTIEPLPDQQVPFNVLRDTVRQFLEGHEGVRVAAIQPTTSGQALVKFEYLFDRDRMVNNSPHDFNGQHFWFVRHNEGCNHHVVEFNREC